jgi:hypothetical protein
MKKLVYYKMLWYLQNFLVCYNLLWIAIGCYDIYKFKVCYDKKCGFANARPNVKVGAPYRAATCTQLSPLGLID